MSDTPLILSCPLPRSLELIFAPDLLADLRARYLIVETLDAGLPGLPDEVLGQARYIIGQPPIDEGLLARLGNLRCIFNVESNLLDNMAYEAAFACDTVSAFGGIIACSRPLDGSTAEAIAEAVRRVI